MEYCSSDDLNTFCACTVSAAELLVHLGDGTGKRGVTVLLVHVHGVCARQVPNHDAVVSNGTSAFFEDLTRY